MSTDNESKWRDSSNVKKAIRKIIRINKGQFPTQKRLIELGYSKIRHYIQYWHNGFSSIRSEMGYGKLRRPNGYYEDKKNLDNDIKEAIEKYNGGFPSQKRFNELGFGSLPLYIRKHYSSIIAVREKFGSKIVRRPSKYCREWKTIRKYLKKVIEENNGEFPSISRMGEMEYGYLSTRAFRSHGGISAVRERIGYNEKIRVKLARELEGIVSDL